MSKIEFFTVIVTLVGGMVVTFLLGNHMGERAKQDTIVKGCKEQGFYLDRNLLLQCSTPQLMQSPRLGAS